MKGPGMRPILTAIVVPVLVGVLVASPARGAAQATDPLSVVTAFNEALNAGNGGAALALVADDAVVRTPGGGVYVGTEQIGAYAQGLIAQHYRAEVDPGDAQLVGERVISRGRVWLDDWRRLGIAPLESVAEAVVRDGKIRSLTATLTPASAAKLEAATTASSRPAAQVPRALPRTGEVAAPAGALVPVGVIAVLIGFGLRRGTWPVLVRARSGRGRGAPER